MSEENVKIINIKSGEEKFITQSVADRLFDGRTEWNGFLLGDAPGNGGSAEVTYLPKEVAELQAKAMGKTIEPEAVSDPNGEAVTPSPFKEEVKAPAKKAATKSAK